MTISAIDSSASSTFLQKIRSRLFEKVDTNTDGQLTAAELEAAATQNGMTAQQADGLYAALGGNTDGSGSLSTSQVDAGLQSLFESRTQNQIYALHASETPAYSSRLSDLFSEADADGDGAVTQKELENVFTSRGGTSQQADALFAALDPQGTGTLTEDQFDSGMRELIARAHHAAAPSNAGTPNGPPGGPPSTQDLSDLFSSLTGGSDTLTKGALEQAFVAEGGTADQADTLFDQLDTDGTGSVSQAEFVSGLQQLTAGGNRPPAPPSLSDVFTALAGGADTLSRSALEQAVVGAGGSSTDADALFDRLDTDGSGDVSRSEFESGPAKPAHAAHAGHGAGGAGASGSANGQPVTQQQVNADGSVTTTVTYPNGTTVTTTTPATSAASTSANGSATAGAGSALGPIDSQTISALFVLLAA